MKSNEIWKPIVGFEGLYEVSNLARIKALKRKGMYGFSYTFNKEIPVIINDLLLDGQVIFNREKNNKITEYEPYEII